MSRRSENFKRSVQIGLAVLSGGLPLLELACDQAPAIVEPAAGNGIPDVDPTALPQAAPTEARVAPEVPPLAASTAEAQPSPTSQVVGLETKTATQADGWQPPRIEDVLTSLPGAIGGELPVELQPFIANAHATITNIGHPDAQAKVFWNGLAGDQARYAVTATSSDNSHYWLDNSAFPTLLDGNWNVIEGQAYEIVPGSNEATTIAWGGIDKSEPSLVKHVAQLPEGNAPLLYWNPTLDQWAPLVGFVTVENNILVGDDIFQYSPEDGNAILVATIPGLTSLIIENGSLVASDNQGNSWKLNGNTRENTITKQTEYYFGEWVTPPVVEGFDQAHIVLENNQIHYRSEGLTQVWSSETKTWVFPEQFYSELGKVVPVSLMGGRLEISDQAAAWQAHHDMVLAMLNNPGSADYLQAVYGKDQLTWDDLSVRDEQGNIVDYEFKTPTVNGTKLCPTFLFVTDYGDAQGYSLCDYVPSNVEAVKVSSPLWIVAGPKEWSANISNFVTNNTLGKERMLFGYWASHGLRITKDGRFVWIGATQEYFDERSARSSNLGGRDGDQIDPYLASAYVASTIKAYEVVVPGMESVTAVPLDVYPDYSSRVILAGVTEQDISEYISNPLFK